MRDKCSACDAMVASLHVAQARSQQCQVLLEANLGTVNLKILTRVTALSLEVACFHPDLKARAIQQDSKFLHLCRERPCN